MKYYNREKKIWEDTKQETGKSLKKRDSCIGGIPHNFVLSLPIYRFAYGNTDDISIEVIERYYELEEHLYNESVKVTEELKSLKLPDCYLPYKFKPSKHYICSKCNKELTK